MESMWADGSSWNFPALAGGACLAGGGGGGGFMAAAPYGDCLIMTPGGTPASGLARATVWAGGATSSVNCP